MRGRARVARLSTGERMARVRSRDGPLFPHRGFPILVSVVWHGCGITVIPISRVLLALDIGCRFSLHTRGVAGLAYTLGV
jgi:hypothetical protein